MWFALKMFGHQTSLKDDNGNLPIHIAASNPFHKILHIPANLAGKKIAEEANRSVIEMLTQIHPNSTQIQNGQGRLPLNLAIESRKCWENGVGSLLRAYPDSLDVVDGKTQLCPFMLAASSETIRPIQLEQCSSLVALSVCNKSEDSLDLTYRLLRSNPMNVLFNGRHACPCHKESHKKIIGDGRFVLTGTVENIKMKDFDQ